jgi:hypothetical protein
MIKSRIVTAIFALLLLHLDVAAIARACAESRSGDEVTQSAAVAHHDHEPQQSEEEPCEHPVDLQCCQMAGTCGATVSLNDESVRATGSSIYVSALVSAGLAQGVNSLPPELPPPKV